MNFSVCIIRAVVTVAAISIFAGCDGSQPQANGPATTTPSDTRRAPDSKSRMLAKSNAGDLLYAVGGCGGTCVLSYPGGTLVGSLNVGQEGACVDSDGNVFITNNTAVVEFAHGGSSPIATLALPGNDAFGCSVDPTTGNLAVTFNGSNANVAIFPGARGTPAIYDANLAGLYCGYDGAGNLFVDGYINDQFALAELPASSSDFRDITVNGSVGFAGQVQWDGRYVTVLGGGRRTAELFLLQVSGSAATVVSSTKFTGITYAYQSWIYKNKILIPYANRGVRARKVGVWNYLTGKKTANLKRFGDAVTTDLHGVALSPGP